MKLTLRKAHRLVSELQSKLSVSAYPQNLHHSSTEEEIREVIHAVESANKRSVEQSLLVAEAISNIRSAVQERNMQVLDGDSVDSLLARKVLIESQMRVLAAFSSPSTDVQEKRVIAITRQISDAAKNPSSVYSANGVTVRGYAIEDHNEFNQKYVELKKEQERVSDKLAYINNSLTVEVDDKFAELFITLQVL